MHPIRVFMHTKQYHSIVQCLAEVTALGVELLGTAHVVLECAVWARPTGGDCWSGAHAVVASKISQEINRVPLQGVGMLGTAQFVRVCAVWVRPRGDCWKQRACSEGTCSKQLQPRKINRVPLQIDVWWIGCSLTVYEGVILYHQLTSNTKENLIFLHTHSALALNPPLSPKNEDNLVCYHCKK